MNDSTCTSSVETVKKSVPAIKPGSMHGTRGLQGGWGSCWVPIHAGCSCPKQLRRMSTLQLPEVWQTTGLVTTPRGVQGGTPLMGTPAVMSCSSRPTQGIPYRTNASRQIQNGCCLRTVLSLEAQKVLDCLYAAAKVDIKDAKRA